MGYALPVYQVAPADIEHIDILPLERRTGDRRIAQRELPAGVMHDRRRVHGRRATDSASARDAALRVKFPLSCHRLTLAHLLYTSR